MRAKLLSLPRTSPRPILRWRQLRPTSLNFTLANDEVRAGLALARAMHRYLRISGTFAALMGHFDAGIAAARRAVVLDPLARPSHNGLGRTLYAARRYRGGGGGLW